MRFYKQCSAFFGSTIENKLTADIEVGDKISGQGSVKSVLYLFTWGSSKVSDGVVYSGGNSNMGSFFDIGASERAKAAAAYDACNNSGAEVLVNPIYTIEQSDYFFYQQTNATVKGFNGTIKSIK